MDNNSQHQDLDFLSNILESRKQIVEWVDMKAQNLITASSILIAVVGFPFISVRPAKSLLFNRFILFAAVLSTLIALSLCLFITKFRFANQMNSPSGSESIASVFGMFSAIRSNNTLSNEETMTDFQIQLRGISEDPSAYFAETILLYTKIAYFKAKYLNLAVILLQISVIMIGLSYIIMVIN